MKEEIKETEKDNDSKKVKCPKCGSEYVMHHQYDSSYKICMKCKHNWKES